MLSGTLWTFSSRFWAVTTSSCTVALGASAAKAWAAPITAAEAVSKAAPLAAHVHRPRDPDLLMTWSPARYPRR